MGNATAVNAAHRQSEGLTLKQSSPRKRHGCRELWYSPCAVLSFKQRRGCGKLKSMIIETRAGNEGTARRRPSTSRERPRPSDFLVVGIGASAGGLNSLSQLFEALPADTGMAFIVIQHLDPTHKSMMADLLGGRTSMKVLEAADDMTIERDHVYVIPPGLYLSIHQGTLRLTTPRERHGARMPFDFFLGSLAEDCGARAVCTVLSGTGADGSVGLTAIRGKGGLVIVQDPKDAAHDGMPRSAILTGAADLVL